VSAPIGGGVLQISGPWGCRKCGWSEALEYDCREGVRMDGPDRVFDPYGVSHHLDDLKNGESILTALKRSKA
jgi:hypothetical protein